MMIFVGVVVIVAVVTIVAVLMTMPVGIQRRDVCT